MRIILNKPIRFERLTGQHLANKNGTRKPVFSVVHVLRNYATAKRTIPEKCGIAYKSANRERPMTAIKSHTHTSVSCEKIRNNHFVVSTFAVHCEVIYIILLFLESFGYMNKQNDKLHPLESL